MSEANKTIQEKLNELAELVAWFQGAEFSLDEATERYQTAETLAKEIEADLKTVKNNITVIKKRFDEAGE